jgi:hypothetical protein
VVLRHLPLTAKFLWATTGFIAAGGGYTAFANGVLLHRSLL